MLIILFALMFHISLIAALGLFYQGLRKLWWKLFFQLALLTFPVTPETKHYEIREIPKSWQVRRMQIMIDRTQGKRWEML